MKTEHKIYAGLAVLGLLGAGIYQSTKTTKAEQESRSVSGAKQDLPTANVPKEDIEKLTKIEIKNGDKPAIVLEKKGEGEKAEWEVVAPLAAKANQTDIKALLDNLRDMKVSEAIDRTTANYEQYELNDAKAVHVTAFKGADKALDAYFGKGGTRGQMARVAGKDGVFAVGGYQAYLYTKEAKNWRDKTVLKLKDEDVKEASSVHVDNANGSFAFVKKDGKWTGTFAKLGKDGKPEKAEGKDAKWEKFEGEKIEEMLRAFKNLNAVDFAEEGTKPADTGLDDPKAQGGVVRVKIKDTEYVLNIGKVQKGKNRYAMKEGGDGTVVVISDWSAGWSTADKTKFEKKDDTKPGKDDGHGHGDMPDMGGLDMGGLDMGGGEE